MEKTQTKKRCTWVSGDPLYIAYHDHEWGRPVHDDRKLFEMLLLEGAQAGLSWITVLKKRENYRKAFDAFDPKKINRYDAKKIKQLLGNEGIIRNKLKIAAAIQNAKLFLELQKEFGSFDRYIWQFVGGTTLYHSGRKKYATTTPESDAMSRELKRRGFNFVGSTICYSFMQAVGMVNDHSPDCFLYRKSNF
jgi:DNA-3-methyladenine glycosylase I